MNHSFVQSVVAGLGFRVKQIILSGPYAQTLPPPQCEQNGNGVPFIFLGYFCNVTKPHCDTYSNS